APSLLDEARAGAGAGSGSGTGRDGSRGRGGMRGRGRGRGRPEDVIATASGPFSLGPAAFARSRQIISGGGASGAHASYTGVQAVKYEGEGGLSGEDREYYGAAAVDMKFGSVTADASVPTGLENPSDDIKTASIKGPTVKEEKISARVMEGVEGDDEGDLDLNSFEGTEGDESDIKRRYDGPARDLLPKSLVDQMFFFQFPSVMPEFNPRPVTPVPIISMASSLASSPAAGSMYSTPDGTEKMDDSEDRLLSVKSEPIDVDRPILVPDSDSVNIKSEHQDLKVGLMEGASSSSSVPVGQRAKSKATATSSTAKQVEKEETEESYLMQEGKIGRLLVYKSGKVKMQVGDIVMDVSSGSECSFLQDVVVVDSNSKQSFVMGSVQKRMVCVPNLTQLLSGLEAVDV
ncbi:hypothetical protein BGZ58_009875, partial [Dissophora ornata]